ncbi:MAG: hypothetical protein U0T81_04165 [Saprospiraceae bacterium]
MQLVSMLEYSTCRYLTNRVFGGGNCDVAIPLAGSILRATRNNTDGWVAQFSKDLGTLYYSTYLSTGIETDGVISLKALSDETFICAAAAADCFMQVLHILAQQHMIQHLMAARICI